ncbi:MAG TPA: DUF2267 domain-containing protein [Candidatus Moranbacteria bacterium]|jgi:uncharacterized protein (DUF2267 family)|nr:DUF2267 domain-containing protein [Candidatus Moranbacteria bacterium]HOF42625.1 DUF2267 domain-containing protein [Candidatus Moranbacteria bacterium]HPX94315.1 DUF2267 domain-containing protein [Candidatus Moranbacteria bacterium]HQB59593.1 DUF2267 domain-containing protein [Candidatus Moranbacteria bacterium]
MPKKGVFDSTIQKSNLLLKDIENEFEWLGSRNRAYSLLKAVIQTVRDRLTVEEAADFGAQLPMLIRGAYYEGWKPSKMPVKFNRAEFIGEVERKFPSDPDISTEKTIRGVFKILGKHIAKNEIRDIENMLPKEFGIFFRNEFL